MKRFILVLLVILSSSGYAEQMVEPEFNGLYAKLDSGKYIEMDHGHRGYRTKLLNGLYAAYGKKNGKQIVLHSCTTDVKPKITTIPLSEFHSFVEKGGYTIKGDYFYKVDIYDNKGLYITDTKNIKKDGKYYCKDNSFSMDLRIKKFGIDSFINKPDNIDNLKKGVIYALKASGHIYYVKFK
ncbi:MAG: hypothetical protein U9R27_06950 [Campylobacterota bacterium]|nr:hypothetical protein [Campylobacterota bacterium]